MRFIDLFAGLGGFHQALQKLGHTCVFASEKKEHLADLYERNYGIKPNRNIRNIDPLDIPDHELLCAGFPCQPFSKAGKQDGLNDEVNGSFFDIIVNILTAKKTKYFILENVRNLETHDELRTWNYIHGELTNLGYTVSKHVMSPHQYNIPQHRERLFIVGSLNGLKEFYWPEKIDLTSTVVDYLSIDGFKTIDSERTKAIETWQLFIDALPKEKPLPGYPIWSMEFGATYPVDIPISKLSNEELEKYRGSYGQQLRGLSYEEKLRHLPTYAVKNKNREKYPAWKVKWINDNRKLWKEQKINLRPIVNIIKNFPVNSWKKFEWNCGDVERNLSKYIIQFRASGVRVKRADFFPSLVTVATQIPIIGWQNRYITPEEGSRIQSFENIELPDGLGTCFSALGNAVNVRLVELIANNLVGVVEEPVQEHHFDIIQYKAS